MCSREWNDIESGLILRYNPQEQQNNKTEEEEQEEEEKETKNTVKRKPSEAAAPVTEQSSSQIKRTKTKKLPSDWISTALIGNKKEQPKNTKKSPSTSK